MKKAVLSLLLLLGFAPACHSSPGEYQAVAENFILSYYLHNNSKEALLFARGPAAERLDREVQLLAGVEPPGRAELPKMTYKVSPCRTTSGEEVQCDYELQIQDVKKRVRHGILTLKKLDSHWFVTDYAEAEYNDS